MKDKITSIRIHESTKKKLQKLKKYPRETDEETLIKVIKKELQEDKNKPIETSDAFNSNIEKEVKNQ